MKYNETKFSDVILLKLYLIVNFFLERFQEMTLKTQGLELTFNTVSALWR